MTPPVAGTVAVDMLAAALSYAARGWAVFPLHTLAGSGCSCGNRSCPNVGKHPRTENGFKDATTDPAVIRKWWKRWPDANIGTATGAVSGIVVLDVDPRHGGDEALADLEAEHGKLPETVESVTGGGGRHIFFRYPENPPATWKKNLCDGVEIKAAGGYIVAPPSLHASGRRYCWDVTVHPEEAPIVEVPSWVLEINGQDERKAPASAVPEIIAPGSRNNTLLSAAGTMRRRGLSAEEILPAIREINQRRCQPPHTEEKLRQIVESVCKYEPAEQLGQAEDANNGHLTEAVAVPLSEIEREHIEWLWPGWLPRGRQTLIAGDPGIGKSWVTQAIAAAVSVGAPLPGIDEHREPENVLLIALEDGAGDTIRPRMEAMGADLDRVHVYTHVREVDEEGVERERGITFPGDIDLLRSLIERTEAALVVIDPLVTVQNPSIDGHRQAAMRSILQPLHQVAQATGAALIVTVHLRKGSAESAIYRPNGSIDLVAMARVGIAVGRDPDNPERRGVAVFKSNLAAFPEPVAFNLRDGQFLWDTNSAAGLTADKLLGPPPTSEGRASQDEAEEFLLDLLADGPKPYKQIQKARREAGISERAVDRAKASLGVRVLGIYEPGHRGAKGWQWVLPRQGGDDPPNTNDAALNKNPGRLEPQGFQGIGLVPQGAEVNKTPGKPTAARDSGEIFTPASTVFGEKKSGDGVKTGIEEVEV